MRVFTVLLPLLFVSVSITFAQGINNLWLAGYENPFGTPVGGLTLNFSNGIPNIYTEDRLLNFCETNCIISDSAGNYLFASNGIFIENSVHDTMVNGSGLNPGPWTNTRLNKGLTLPQGNLVIPFPNEHFKYYLFHETIDDYGNTYGALNLYFTIIDMSLQGGLGEVIQKNVILLNDTLVNGKLNACKHANGRDWWLICHQLNSNLFYKYLITPYGIQGPYLQSIGAVRLSRLGQNKFSLDGKLFAYYDPDGGDLDIFDFDRCNGVFTLKEHVDINDSVFGGGVEFSPNSLVLYVSSLLNIYQFDMMAADISASMDTVAVWDGTYSPSPPFATTFYLSQLAPDGKIYISCGNSTLVMHVINHPDILGDSCNVCQHCIQLPRYNAWTVPNYPNYFLGSEPGSICDSLISVNDLIARKISISVYPNPVENQSFSISYPVTSSTSTLEIYNVDGKKVAIYSLPQWSSFQRIELPELSGGIYVARIQNDEYSSDVKFIVQ